MRVTRVASMAVAAVVVACVADETTRSQAAAIGSGLIQATLIYNYNQVNALKSQSASAQ